jgi:uncharacterized protein (TIGR02996 family)
MSIEQAFLADVIDHPEDDGPRLIYADWLEENATPGDSRSKQAELIRLQIELARGPAQDRGYEVSSSGYGRIVSVLPWPLRDDPMIAAAQMRMQELARELFPIGSWGCRSCRIERGFPSVLDITFKNLCKAGPLFERYPFYHVHVTKARNQGDSLAQLAFLARLRSLSLGEVASADLEALARCQSLGNLRKLAVQAPTQDDVLALLSAPALSPVTVLQVNKPYERPLEVMDGSSLPAWNGLWLQAKSRRGRSDSNDPLLRLAASPRMSHVQQLHLSDRAVTAAGVWALARSAHLQRLEQLDLSLCPLDETAIGHLTAAPWLGQLRLLSLVSVFPIDDSSLTTLAGWLLRLGRRPRDESLLALGERLMSSSRIERLDLRGNRISRTTVARLREQLGERLLVSE